MLKISIKSLKWRVLGFKITSLNLTCYRGYVSEINRRNLIFSFHTCVGYWIWWCCETTEVPIIHFTLMLSSILKLISWSSTFIVLHITYKICQNTDFLWPVFSRLRTESTGHRKFAFWHVSRSNICKTLEILYQDISFRICNSVFVWKNTDRRKPVFLHILRNVTVAVLSRII